MIDKHKELLQRKADLASQMVLISNNLREAMEYSPHNKGKIAILKGRLRTIELEISFVSGKIEAAEEAMGDEN